ncbi:MAG: hypothetical protein KA163_05015 [Bacteroidia bacterium]|nr:hypothetical protein [Bacteroidia bacterium]
MIPGNPNIPPPSELKPNSPIWVDIPLREIKEYEWQYDENGNLMLPTELPQREFNPDETSPRKRLTKSKSMKKAIIILLTLIFLLGCERRANKQTQVPVIKQTERKSESPYSNPALIYGSSFGEFFQSLYRNNQFEQMLFFTSSKTINQFGRAELKNYYKQKFKFDYVLGHLSNMVMVGDTILLTYSKAHIHATRRKIVIRCLIENDTVKLVLNKLERTPFD